MPSRSLLAAGLFAVALAGGALFSLTDGFSPTAVAEEVTVGPMSISNLWARATPIGAPTAAGYLTIANPSDTADRLLAIASPVAQSAEIHEMRMEGERMIMRPAEGGLAIPAGATVTLAPSGFHIMFTGIGAGFREGDSVPVTLTFERAGAVDAVLAVMPIGARGPATAAAAVMPGMAMPGGR